MGHHLLCVNRPVFRARSPAGKDDCACKLLYVVMIGHVAMDDDPFNNEDASAT
jgi:hypothetical protein